MIVNECINFFVIQIRVMTYGSLSLPSFDIIYFLGSKEKSRRTDS